MDKERSFSEISRAYSDASILMHEAIARSAGLSGTDHKYLGLLIQAEQMTAGEIAKQTGLTTGSVTALIDRFEKQALVRREADPNDRRKVLVIPYTKRILELLQPIFADLQERTMELADTFSVGEMEAIKRYFTSATEIMKSVANNLNQLK